MHQPAEIRNTSISIIRYNATAKLNYFFVVFNMLALITTAPALGTLIITIFYFGNSGRIWLN